MVTTRLLRRIPHRLVALVCTLAIATCGAAQAPQRMEDASPAGLAAHPRLLFGVASLPAVRAAAAGTHQSIWRPIDDYARSRLGSQPPLAAPADATEDTYRNYGDHLIAVAFACAVSESPAQCALARDYLMAYTSWERWDEGEHRDLGLAHMLVGVALAYDWLAPSLSDVERAAVRNTLASRAQMMYEASTQPYRAEWNNFWGTAYAQNHCWIAHSALGLSGLALLDEDERAPIWVGHAAARLTRVRDTLDAIGDGSWHESIHYQSYGLTMLLPFLVNLRALQRTDLIPHTYLRAYAAWRIYNALPQSTEFLLAYGDVDWSWGNAYAAQNILRFAAREYRDGRAEWMAQRLLATDGRPATVWTSPWYVFELLYYDPAVPAVSPDRLPLSRTFGDLEGVIWRGGWGDEDLAFGLKAGAYGGRYIFDTFSNETFPWEPPCSETGCQLSIGHDHDDMNGFYLFRGREWLAPETEGVDRFQTSFHNTLLIDGMGQDRPPYEHYGRYPEDFRGGDGRLEATAGTPGFDYLAASATGRYRQIADLTNVTRHVLFVRPGYLVMLDACAAAAPHRYEWVVHFGEHVWVEGGWLRGDAGGGQTLGVAVVSPRSFSATVGNDGRPYARVAPTTATPSVALINVLYPMDQASWGSRPLVTLLSDTGHAAAVGVRTNDGGARTDDILLQYRRPVAATSLSSYVFDGTAAVVRRGADGELTQLFVYGGTSLVDRDAGAVLVQGLDGSTAFEAVYAGGDVALYGVDLIGATLYAPEATRITVNGVARLFGRTGDYITVGVPHLVYMSTTRRKGP